MFFPEAVAAILAGRVVRFPLLVEFQFDEPQYVWGGYRDLVAGGKTWKPIRGAWQISGLGDFRGTESAQLTISLSGAIVTEEIVQMAINAERTAYVNRLLRIWAVPLDEFWKPTLDGPFNLVSGIMTSLPISESMDDAGAVTRTLTIEAENIFFGRSGVPNSYRSDRDQKARFPGDRGFEFVTSLINAKVSRPW